LQRICLQPSDSRWKNGRPFMVAYVGVIAQQEGLDLLLDSVADLVQRRGRHDIQFVIVGGGPDQQNVVQMAQDAGLKDYVSFPGRVDDQTLFTILSTADLCVNPDRPNTMNDRSTMIKIMEYMALGKPIVQYDLTEGRFSAQEASLYARPSDPIDFAGKMLEILDHPELAQRMGKFGVQRVRNELAWEHQAKKLLAAYEAIFTV
jgi:glycosyltransferase involved in cell wall biosynthesis